MKDLTKVEHYEPIEKVSEILMNRAFGSDPLFFKLIIAYFLSKISTTMRTKVELPTGDIVPTNMYAMNLAPSGTGKTSSIRLIEKVVLRGFRDNFMGYTLAEITERNIAKLAIERGNYSGEDPDRLIPAIRDEYNAQGKYYFEFDSGTAPAAKQMRHKLLIAGIGSINLEIDEIGNNLLGNKELLDIFLELFDTGEIKHKLVKNTADNKRVQEILGGVPANMLLFGTPAKLLAPGSKQESEFMSMLDTGYARRCFFGYCTNIKKKMSMTSTQILKQQKAIRNDPYLRNFATHLGKFANPINYDVTLTMPDPTALLWGEYLLECEDKAEQLSQFEQYRIIELQHRHSKAVKLAGTYAFIDSSDVVTEEHLLKAIKLTEESGEAFNAILSRESNYSILANFIADYDGDLTMTDMMDSLYFLKGSEASKKETLTRAIEYGYANNVIIKRNFLDNIEFYSGEKMEITDPTKLIISYSKDITQGYLADYADFKDLDKLLLNTGYHYTAHHYENGYRSNTSAIPGFHLVILDVDNGSKMSTAQMLLKDYTAIFTTTKRHTPSHNRFRIILPLSHKIKLKPDSYSKFMQNVFRWLPFQVDDQTKDAARKWESYPGTIHIQQGKLLDALQFIPNTRAEEAQTKRLKQYADLSSLERWFCLNTDIGNRNNQLIRYALALVDSGQDAVTVRESLKGFNTKLTNPLSINEIDNTVMKTVLRKIKKQGAA